MLVLHRHRTQHIVEIICWYNFAESQDEFAIDQLLPPPKLVEFRTVKWVRARQRIVPLHAASLSIRVLTVELQKLDSKAATSPTEDFLRIQANSQDKQSIKAPLARIGTTGKQAICISGQQASQEKSRVFRQAKKSLDRFLQLTCACANINC